MICRKAAANRLKQGRHRRIHRTRRLRILSPERRGTPNETHSKMVRPSHGCDPAVTLAAPAALAAESTVTIKTAEDLAELSRNCTLDTWSQGKTVILKNDLDLHGVDFTPIPTFSGTFQGNGHTISGLTLTGSGNVRGLFRYIQTGATVQDLTVMGTIHPNGHQG